MYIHCLLNFYLSYIFLEYKEAFEIFDENKDGKIDVQELGCVIRSMGKTCTETELKDMIKEFDTDGFFKLLKTEILTFHPFREWNYRTFRICNNDASEESNHPWN